MSNPIIFGAGLAGLITARMLADRHPVVFERQDTLPNNHAALLRFRDREVSLSTNIPFKEVRVLKAVHGSTNPVNDAIRYSHKVTGGYFNRSISDLTPSIRYVAPPDMISLLASTADINYGVEFVEWSHNLLRENRPIISTIPLPIMMDIFEWKRRPDFKFVSGWTIRAELNPDIPCDLNCTVYFPGTEPYYRVSVTGRTMIVEGASDFSNVNGILGELVRSAARSIGLRSEDIESFKGSEAKYQKIAELTSEEREQAKRFIMWLSDKHNIYSIGRFAVWRPKLLLDDIPNDVRVIARLIDGETHYEERKRP